MKILVLGASGQVGREVFAFLRGRGHEVTGTSRSGGKDLLQFDPYSEAWHILPRVDALVNCIGQMDNGQRSLYEAHVVITQRMLEHRKQLGSPRVVQVSAVGADPESSIEYARTKGIADTLLLREPDTAVIRPSIICTHDTMLVQKMRMLRTISRYLANTILVPGAFMTTLLQPVLIEDVCGGIELLCMNPLHQRVITAVGSDRFTLANLITMLTPPGKPPIRVFALPGLLTNTLVQGMSFLFPRILSKQQYELLKNDNIGDAAAFGNFLGYPPASSRPFFEKEFHARN